MQAVNGRWSSLQRNVEPATLDLKRKVGVRSMVLPLGPAVIVVFGTGQACSVGATEFGRGDGAAWKKSAPLWFVSSAVSSRVGQCAAIERFSELPSAIAASGAPVTPGSGVPLVLLKPPHDTQSGGDPLGQQIAPPAGSRLSASAIVTSGVTPNPLAALAVAISTVRWFWPLLTSAVKGGSALRVPSAAYRLTRWPLTKVWKDAYICSSTNSALAPFAVEPGNTSLTLISWKLAEVVAGPAPRAPRHSAARRGTSFLPSLISTEHTKAVSPGFNRRLGTLPRMASKRQIWVGKVPIGGGAPVAVQTMTKTETANLGATMEQIGKVAEAGADLVRVAVPRDKDVEALRTVVRESPIPVIADIHFNHTLALKAIDAGAHCIRLNPGNIGGPDKVAEVAERATAAGVPMRIGVNSGSLPKHLHELERGDPVEALVQAAVEFVELMERLDYENFKVSIKSTNVPNTIAANRLLASKIDYPLHLGITEAGTKWSGSLKSAVGLGTLLADGVGDTIRISLSTFHAEEEVKVAWEILKALQLRQRGPVLIACPTCGRLQFDMDTVVAEIEQRLEAYQEPIEVAVLGCAVNGIGEASHADFGITGAKDEGLIFAHGKPLRKVPQAELVDALFAEIDRSLDRGGVEVDADEADAGARWLARIEEDNAGELTPERIARMEAEAASADGAEAEPLPALRPAQRKHAVSLDEDVSPVAGRRFTRT